MKKYFFIILSYVCLAMNVSYAQTVNHEFNDVSLSDALLVLDNDCDSITVNFIYNELEDFKVTANVQHASIFQAVKQVCGYYPMRITQLNTDIFVECTQKDSIRFIGQVLDSRRRPVRFATVMLLSADRDTLNYGLTNDDGYFVIPCPARQAFVRVSHLSYNTSERFYKHEDVGVITLTEANMKLEPTDVTAEKPDNAAIRRSYHSLWRQVYKHSVADLPRSQLEVLATIRTKARMENNYGQMLTAELMRASLVKELEPDSLSGIVREMMDEERSAETRNPILAAVYQTILTNMPPVKGVDDSDIKPYYDKVMSNVGLLAANKADVLSPFVSVGGDSEIFGNDLLSVVGMQTQNYQLLHDYYAKEGNRKAEMLTALMIVEKDSKYYYDNNGNIIHDRFNHYLAQLDSLCTLYADQPECCEIALVRYKAMCEKKDVTLQEKIQYIDDALNRWGEWRNANALINERALLSEPKMKVDVGEMRQLPDSSRIIRFHHVRNVKSVSVRISRLDISQTDRCADSGPTLTIYNYKNLLKSTTPVEVATYRKRLNIPNEFDCVEDSMLLPGLPVGRYLAEVYSEECTFDTLRFQLAVSDVFLLLEPLPNKNTRVVVVRGSTGQPLPGAKVLIYERDETPKVYSADEKGELLLSKKFGWSERICAAVKGDEAAPSISLYNSSYFQRGGMRKQKVVNIYTDRAIYRPGQQVNVAMVAFKNNANMKINAWDKKRLSVRVSDPNNSHVADTTLVTDEYGTASFSFKIPTDRINGSYRITVVAGRSYHVQSFKVEEYKNPTFSVDLATMEKAEIVGDTILLPGTAKAFSGAQISNAQVTYKVERKRGPVNYMSWTSVFQDTIQTDVSGSFRLKIPVKVPQMDDDEDQWSFRVKAIVTDMGGESHEAEQTITMNDKERFFDISLPEKKIEIGNPIMLTLEVKDKWMQPVDTLVAYYVDTPVNKQTAKSNEPIQVAECEALHRSGEHTLYAICEGDTVKTQFYIINYDDVRPGAYTRECFAQSAERFPADGGDVRIQLGTSMQDVYVVYDIFADNKRLEGGAFTLSDQMYNRKFTYQPEYGAGICMTFAFVKDGVVYTEKAVIVAPRKERKLQMQWESFRDRLTPGQKEEWTLKITHPDGTPAKAQMLSVLYDASLDQLVQHDWWSRSQMLGFSTASTKWVFDKKVSLSGGMVTKVKMQRAVKPLDFSHFNYDLLFMRANELTLTEIAKVSKVMNKGKRHKGKRGYLMGLVVDETGEPVIGASVVIGSNKKGTVTNFDGEFEIESSRDAYVKVSYVGCVPQEIWINSGAYVVIELIDDYNELNEVVVVGYGVQKKSSLTGSVVIEGVPTGVAVSMEDANASLAAAPLYVVDGVIVNDISDYKDRIASISVLKGASAVGVYGAQASNGVVVISTNGTPITDALQEIDKQLAAAADTQQPVRENMEETAFFYPSLLSSEDGQLKLQFTLPEAVTTWRFLGMAHDQEMNLGMMDCKAIAQKEVMVQPNLPRFIRRGDHATIEARVSNITETPKDGVAQMTVSDAETGKVLYTDKRNFHVEGNTTTSVPFSFVPNHNGSMLVCRTTVSGESFSDGEQRWLPLLPDREMTTDTYVLTQHASGQSVVDIDSLLTGSAYDNRRLMVEYTENPAWMMVLAMPTYTARPNDDAISQVVALYANMVGGSIMYSSPLMMQRLRQWRDNDAAPDPFLSELEKNEQMSELLVSETPWMNYARAETSMRRSLMKFFDQPTMKMRIDNALSRLKALQHSDGGWAWWKGMPSSEYTTLAVMEILARMYAGLNTTLAQTASEYDVRRMLTTGLSYLDNIAVEQVDEMKDKEQTLKKENKKPRGTRSATILMPDDELLHYLYISSLYDNHPSSDVKDARKYLMSYVKNKNLDLTIYGKAVFAVILAKEGQKEKAREYLKSLKEYAVVSPDKGMYFDTPRAMYSWCDYRVPTVTMAIEAIQLVEPEDKESVELMRKWLLSQKRVQKWDSEITAVDAIHAFFGDNKTEINKKLDTDNATTICLGDKVLNNGSPLEGLGYTRMIVTDSINGKLRFDKKSENTSWASVCTQSMKRMADIGDASMGMTVKREILKEKETLKVGDKVKVRITIEAEQDYDFVQIIDKRAACMEPVDVLSGYKWGYYRVVKDNVTQYFFSRLRKGTTTFETEYYIDRVGQYETGTCTAQCAYSPAFSARTGSLTINVE